MKNNKYAATVVSLAMALSLAAGPVIAADQRIQYTEEMVGANHPTKADTLNRLVNVEHNTDGTHKTDAIAEKTAGHGVTIDGVTLKDGGATVLTGGTNTFNVTNGTASLDVAAGATVNVDANLTVSAATTLDEAVAMSSKAPKASPVFTGTVTAPVINTTAAAGNIATATPTTILTMNEYSMYIISVYGQELGANYNAMAFGINDGTGKTLIGYHNGANITLTVSGANVQVTHTRGSNADLVWIILKIK